MDKGGKVPKALPIYPNCEICPKPELVEENEQAWEAYRLLSTQPLMTGMGDVYGMDYKVIAFVFDMMRIPDEDRPEIFQKLVILESVQAKFRAVAARHREAARRAR